VTGEHHQGRDRAQALDVAVGHALGWHGWQ
jgi:hypothetical protein